MLRKTSTNTTSLLTGLLQPIVSTTPSIRFFNINTQQKVVQQSLFINRDNPVSLQDHLKTDKISITSTKNENSRLHPSPSNPLEKEKDNRSKAMKNRRSTTPSNPQTKNSSGRGNRLNQRPPTKVPSKPKPSMSSRELERKKKKTSSHTQKITTKKSARTTRNKTKRSVNESKYFTRQIEEMKIEELLLTNNTQISVVSGPSYCGKTKLIQNALQTLDINYVILESDDFKSNESLYTTLQYQISPVMRPNTNTKSGRSRSRNSTEVVDDDMIFDLLRSIPEQIPVIIDDASALFDFVPEEGEEEEENISLKINPIIFEWIYDGLENDRKLNVILVSSNPLVECWIDINIPNEIVCHCPIKDLTYDEAEDFFYTYLNEKGIDTIDLTFEDVYPITGTRLSIIKDFIQEYLQRSTDEFNDLDFSTLNNIYNKLNELLESAEQPQLLKRIMAIMVSESDRGYVEEKELEYIFTNNQGLLEEEDNEVEVEEETAASGSEDFWEVIAMLIEHHLLNRNIMEFTSPEPLPSSRQYTQTSSSSPPPVIIKRPVLFPENQCVLYAMNLILQENNIQVRY